MNEFPFEHIYKTLAHRLIQQGLPKDGILPPALLMMRIENGTIADLDVNPVPHLFEDARGEFLFRALLDKIVSIMPEDACVAFVSEAHYRSVTLDANARGKTAKQIQRSIGLPNSLTDDPLAVECLLINLYRPKTSRSGRLLIKPGRRLEYRPLDPSPDGSEAAPITIFVTPEEDAPKTPASSRPFVDAQEKQRLHPDEFEAPDAAELDEVRPGWHVMVCPQVDGRSERFWVKVEIIDGDTITGMIDNDLVRTHIHGLRDKDRISFERRHVYKTRKP